MKKIGFLAGAFDIIHPGYIHMFEAAKNNCDWLVVGLQTDPSIERPDKLTPILSFVDRMTMLKSIKYIDEVRSYTTEDDLILIITELNPDVRFLGDDYHNKPFTADHLNIPIHYVDRSHNWSSTKMKQLIYQQIKQQKHG